VASENLYLTVEVASAPDVQTIALAGEADLLGAPQIEAALEGAAAGAAKLIVVDLKGLTFIDSSGLQALATGHEHCRSRGYELRIVRGPANVQRLFDLTGMSEILPFVDAVEVDSETSRFDGGGGG
jgi:anti-sigma B factor antagonist